MQKTRTAAFLFASALVLAAPAFVMAELCDTACYPGVECAQPCERCIAPTPDGYCNSTRWTTCGQAGYSCTSCPPAAWVEYRRDPIEAWQKNFWLYCEHWHRDRIYEYDAHGCEQPRTRCDDYLVGRGTGWPYSDCCNPNWPCYDYGSC